MIVIGGLQQNCVVGFKMLKHLARNDNNTQSERLYMILISEELTRTTIGNPVGALSLKHGFSLLQCNVRANVGNRQEFTSYSDMLKEDELMGTGAGRISSMNVAVVI